MQSQTPSAAKGGKSEEELKEEEELQLAIALSQSEAQAKEEAKKRATSKLYASPKSSQKEKSTVDESKEQRSDSKREDDLDPELMRYLDRDYWENKEKEKAAHKSKQEEQKQKVQVTSSPSKVDSFPTPAAMSVGSQNQVLPPVLAGGATDEELDEFVTTLKTQVEIFVNRMKSNSSRGRSITNDSSVQTLFMNTMAMHSKLLKHIQDQEDKRVYYEGLQDKLTQVKDARAALDALREEERERKRREAEEAERIRQIQMREKLEVMRKKKQEYLQYQRQVALQRMQEQEREMKLRQEQAKQQYMIMQQHYAAPPGSMYGMAPPQGMPPGMQSQPGVPPHYMPSQYPATTAGAPQGYPIQPGGAQPHNYDPGMTPVSTGPTGIPSQMGMVPGVPTTEISGQQQPPPQPPASSFNMQGMAAALPPGSQHAPPLPMAGYQVQGVPVVGPTQDPGQYQQHTPSMANQQPPSSQPNGGVLDQAQSLTPGAPSAELISFD